MIKSQSSLDLFCLRLGLPIEVANSPWLVDPIPFRSLQLSDSLPLPKCSRLLDLERDIDEPYKQSKPHKEIFNKVGPPRWEGKESPLHHHHLLWSLTSALPMSADSLGKRLWHLSISFVLQPPWTLGNAQGEVLFKMYFYFYLNSVAHLLVVPVQWPLENWRILWSKKLWHMHTFSSKEFLF